MNEYVCMLGASIKKNNDKLEMGNCLDCHFIFLICQMWQS